MASNEKNLPANSIDGPQQEDVTREGEPQLETPVLALRPKQAEQALHIGKNKLWELTNRGAIPHLKLDKIVLYPVDALRDWLKQQAKGGRK